MEEAGNSRFRVITVGGNHWNNEQLLSEQAGK